MNITSLTAALVAATSVYAAQANDFVFDYSGDGLSFIGGLITSDTVTANIDGHGHDGYQILSIFGTRNGSAIAPHLVTNPNFPGTGAAGGTTFDDALLLGPLGLDFEGLMYTLNGRQYKIFFSNSQSGGTYKELADAQGDSPVSTDIVVVLSEGFMTAVPDAGNTAYMLGGIAGGVICLSRLQRRRNAGQILLRS